MQHKQAFIFFGVSGSGKGTQAELLQKHLETIDNREICNLETGKRFRELTSKETYAGQKAAEITNNGGLQPVFLSIWNWTDFFLDELKDNQHLIIDGSPRRLEEPNILETAFDFFEYKDVHIIFLNVEHGVVKDRLMKRGRHDDLPEKIDRRLAWFQEQVLPMLAYYRASSRYHFHDVNGALNVDEVHAEVLKALTL
jgi:adenylate kinase family enzyme